IRPQTPAEVVDGCGVCARAGGAAGDGGIALGSERAFTFDYAFEPTSDQQDVYDTCVRKLVEAALDGYNATVLAYGQLLLMTEITPSELMICDDTFIKHLQSLAERRTFEFGLLSNMD
ncbi:jg4399, partial [Pararge aegeria aegeria]